VAVARNLLPGPWLCNCKVPTASSRKGNPHHDPKCVIRVWYNALLLNRDDPSITVPEPEEGQVVSYIATATLYGYQMEFKNGKWIERAK